MAFGVDEPEPVEVSWFGDDPARTRDLTRPAFQPMRRKLHPVVDA